MKGSISVVICAYTTDRWSQLVAAIAAVSTQDTPVDDVILVVDHNQVLLSRARLHFRSTRVVANAGAPGLSAARNTGVSTASGEIIVFLDDDAVPEADWITRLVASYADQSVLGVGGAAIPVWEGSIPAWWPAEFLWVVGCSYRGQPTRTSRVRNLMGCNMSIRRAVLQRVGGFDTGLGRTANKPLGAEETELCIRAQQLFPDGQFIYEPRAVVRHFVPTTRTTWRYFRARCRAEGLSKARVARRVGRDSTLAAESVYTRRVLPKGVARSVAEGLHGDADGLARAGAIVAGLSFTTASYLVASLSYGLAARRKAV